MQSALALVNSTTRSIRSVAKEVRFLIYKFKEGTTVCTKILKIYLKN